MTQYVPLFYILLPLVVVERAVRYIVSYTLSKDYYLITFDAGCFELIWLRLAGIYE